MLTIEEQAVQDYMTSKDKYFSAINTAVSGSSIIATPDIETKVLALRYCRAQAKVAQEEANEAEKIIGDFMGNNTILISGEFGNKLLTYTTQTRNDYKVEQTETSYKVMRLAEL